MFKKCGFRDIIHVCKFKEEDCNPKECDMYDIEFKVKPILKQARTERKNLIKLQKEINRMKKCGDHKKSVEKYKKLKLDRDDKAIGMFKLSKAIMYLKRTKSK